jgi:hypothetical protein
MASPTSWLLTISYLPVAAQAALAQHSLTKVLVAAARAGIFQVLQHYLVELRTQSLWVLEGRA